jgi:hypothetical protein
MKFKDRYQEVKRRTIYTSKHALKRALLQGGVYGATVGILDAAEILDKFIDPSIHAAAPAAVYGAVTGGSLGLVAGTVDATMRYNELVRILKDPRIPEKDKKLIRKELLGEDVRITVKDKHHNNSVLEDINILIEVNEGMVDNMKRSYNFGKETQQKCSKLPSDERKKCIQKLAKLRLRNKRG